jgi:hypothetical protein
LACFSSARIRPLPSRLLTKSPRSVGNMHDLQKNSWPHPCCCVCLCAPMLQQLCGSTRTVALLSQGGFWILQTCVQTWCVHACIHAGKRKPVPGQVQGQVEAGTRVANACQPPDTPGRHDADKGDRSRAVRPSVVGNHEGACVRACVRACVTAPLRSRCAPLWLTDLSDVHRHVQWS